MSNGEVLEALNNIQNRVNDAVELLNAGLPSRGGPMHPVAAKLLGISIEVGKATAALDLAATAPPLGEGGLAGTFARYAKHFADHTNTVEVTLTPKEIQQIADALAILALRSGAMREALAAWFDVEIEAAKEKQIDGFKTATEQGQLAGERAHARQCAFYEAKRVVTAAVAAPQAQENWIDQNYQIDRYGVALMMIREGCADPTGFARRVLAEFGDSPHSRPHQRQEGS